MPTFSVIIPTYNSEETISASLDAIVSQTFTDVEVYIQDGQSKDATLAIVDRYKERLDHLVVVSEEDQGIYDAMNRAMAKVNGDWLIFLGSDDTFYDNEVLAKTAAFLEKTEAKVVYGDAKIIGDTGWAKDGELYAGEFTLAKLLNQNICHQAMFYNTNFVRQEIGDFNIAYKKSSDWDFNLRCWAKAPFVYLDLVIANFAAGGFSTNSNDNKLVEDYLANVLSYFGVGLFHPMVNRPSFIFYPEVMARQQREHPYRYRLMQLKQRIARKLGRK
ncbi:glycosyltransferase family 2 protein [Sungkyunkwania multivorans]|uniref:Glycosyltransferase family 2 protein n=1 Tax=Sungkyunkwania multivorans TaxID=1173618 RepID=A0ABW3D455_9FLAO